MKARNSSHGDMPAAFITMISESVDELVEHVRDRDQQRDRRDHQHQQRDDQPGDADEHQDGLALAGDRGRNRAAPASPR